MRSVSKYLHERYRNGELNPGTPTAHERFCLVLLCSQPDTIHKLSLRRTKISTSLTAGGFTKNTPQTRTSPLLERIVGTGHRYLPGCMVGNSIKKRNEDVKCRGIFDTMCFLKKKRG